MIYLPAVDEFDPIFPSADQALDDPDGLLAIGGRLNTLTLTRAYAKGIFPWFEEGQSTLWWCPSDRAILIPGREHTSRSMAKLIRRGGFQITTDRCFGDVIRQCAAPRATSSGTWITPPMQRAYMDLYREGHAHSVECWQGEELVGGLYGVQVGGIFCGESMFSRRPNASKLAFIALSRTLAAAGFTLIDCQLENPHLLSLGVEMVCRREFLKKLEIGGKQDIHWPESERFYRTLAGSDD